MRGRHSWRLTFIAVVVAALAGGTLAAVTATGQSGHPSTAIEVDSVHPAPVSSDPARLPQPSRLQAAAEYLGISAQQLTSELKEGASLGQIASATPGRSESGLIQTLVSERRQRLTKAAETLPKRVKAVVAKPGGPGSGSGGGLLAVARSYLGITAAELTKDLHSGETLESIAESTPGRSREGLSRALYDARVRQVETAIARGKLGEPATKIRLAHVQQRVERILSRTHRTGPRRRTR